VTAITFACSFALTDSGNFGLFRPRDLVSAACFLTSGFPACDAHDNSKTRMRPFRR